MALTSLAQLGVSGPIAGFPGAAPFQSSDLASLRCSQGLGMPEMTSAMLAGNQQLMGGMLQLMSMLLTGLMSNGASSSSSDAVTATAGGSAGGDVSQQSPPPTGGQVKSGSKVLVIGDSHTAGAFGDELDRLLRAKGAQVHTVGSSGATADNFISGKGTTVGYADHKINGQTQKTAAHATPKLEELINEDKPDTILVNLGANFRGAGPSGIKKQVDEIGQIAKKHGIKITWVGPPTTRQDESNRSSLQKFDEDMKAAVAPYGTYVSSAPFTPKYSGGDGVHYSGEAAKQWAAGVAGAV